MRSPVTGSVFDLYVEIARLVVLAGFLDRWLLDLQGRYAQATAQTSP
jgi:hypothetical protein